MPSRKSSTRAASSDPKRPRSAMSSTDVAHALASIKESRAARRIQRMYRTISPQMLTRTYVAAFFKPVDGVTQAYALSISFEALVIHLREPPIIASARNCLCRIHALALHRHDAPAGETIPDTINVRVFLAAYMIACRPTHVFENMGQLETPLLEVARALIGAFERIACAVLAAGSMQPVDRALTEDFVPLLLRYLRCFKAWKVPDEIRLVCRIRHALFALYDARGHLPADEPADSRLSVELRVQIDRLRVKLLHIGGQTALTQFDADNHGVNRVELAADAGRNNVTIAPSRMCNELLAHELLLDPAFQLTADGECDATLNPSAARMRETFHRAFWDSLADELRLAAPCFTRVVRVLLEVRDAIVDLSGSREADTIREIIDGDFIRTQAERQVFGWVEFGNLVGSIVRVIKRIQAPVRDAETAALWTEMRANIAAATAPADQPVVLCKALEFLLSRVNVMRIDAANARLRLIAPVVRDHGIDYERGKFQAKIDSGALTLARTEECFQLAVARETAANTVSLEDLASGQARAFAHVHAAVFVSTFSCPTCTVSADILPETLGFDVRRIAKAATDFQRIIDGATTLVVATHALLHNSTDVTTQASHDALHTLTTSLLETEGDLDVDTIFADFVRQLDAANLIPDPAERANLRKAFDAAVNKQDHVRTLIAERVRRVLTPRLASPTSVVDPQPIASFRSFVPRIEALVAKLAPLVSINRAVHTPTYNRIIAAAVAARVGAAVV